MKSVKPKDGTGEPPAQGGGRNAEADFHGQKRSNDTHAYGFPLMAQSGGVGNVRFAPLSGAKQT
jgi:hypothetical protein